MKIYNHSHGKELEKINKYELFKFGDTIYKTIKYVKIPLQIGILKDTFDVGVVAANVPLLISKTKLKE